MRTFALIPAFEPDSRLISLLREIQSAKLDAVVIDDGSGEKYQTVFSEAAGYAAVLHHAENLGKGAALRTGLLYVARNCPEPCTVVTMDADGQHTVADAQRIAKEAALHPDTLILGSRKLKESVSGEKIPLRSRLGNGITRKVFTLRTGMPIYDTQTGLRAFSSDFIPVMLQIDGERYEYEINVLLYFADHHLTIEEIPIQTIYLPDNHSHFHTVKDAFRVYRTILRRQGDRRQLPQVFRFALSSFVSFLTDYGLYALLVTLFSGISLSTTAAVTWANVIARIGSASLNYTLNRRLVFHADGDALRSALSYAALACGILAGNTALLNVLISLAGMDRYAAKVVAEIAFFILSWLVQKFLIFAKKEVRG